MDTNWVHIVPMTTCFFQSRVQKNTNCHKGCDWLTTRKYYGDTITKKLRLIIIGFDTPPMTAATMTMTSSPSPTLPVMPATQAKAGAQARAIAIAIRLGQLQWSRCCPCCWRWCQAHPPPPGLVAPAPAHHAAKVRCPVFLDVSPLQTDVPGSNPQAISAAGTPAAQITGPTVPWPSSAPFWPATVAVVIVLEAVVRGQYHHPGKPVQAGEVVGRVDPACTRQVSQGAPCNGAATNHLRSMGRMKPAPRTPTAVPPCWCTPSARY